MAPFQKKNSPHKSGQSKQMIMVLENIKTFITKKETVKERAILQEKITEGRINGKNAMTVSDINELKGHRGSAIHGIFITAGRAETAVTTERNKLEISAVDTAIHGTTIRRITTVDHLIDIFHLSRSGMKSIFDFFIMICKDLL